MSTFSLSKLLPAVALLAATCAAAAEGRIPVYQATTITSPGSYFLSRGIQGAGPDLIVIAASNVDLDLNGQTLQVPVESGAAIRITAGQTDIAIRNGTIRGPAIVNDLDLTGRLRIRLQELHLSPLGSAISVSLNAVDHLEVRDLVIADTGSVFTVGGSFTAQISRSRFSAFYTSFSGMHNGVVRDSVFESGGPWGLRLTTSGPGGNLFEGNTFRGGNNCGLLIEANATVLRGNVFDTSIFGLCVNSSANRIEGNEFLENNTGIGVTGFHNLIQDNMIQGGPGCGINFGSADGAVYRNNILRYAETPLCGVANVDAGGNVY